MKKLLYFPFKWLVFLPLFIVYTAVMAFSCIVVCVVVSPTVGSRYIAKAWAKYSYLLSLSRVEVIGRENIQAGQSYVVAANHLSQFDILVLYGWLNIDLKWVMKKELRKAPFIGAACAAMGHIFLDRKSSQKALEALRSIKKTLPAGTSVLFFPEGTRSNGKMKRFKRGAFSTAKALEFPVLPITINGTEHIVPNGTIDLMLGKAQLIIHPPISIEEVNQLEENELTQKTQEIIASARPEEFR